MERLCDTCQHKEVCCATDEYDRYSARLTNADYDFFSINCIHYMKIPEAIIGGGLCWNELEEVPYSHATIASSSAPIKMPYTVTLKSESVSDYR